MEIAGLIMDGLDFRDGWITVVFNSITTQMYLLFFSHCIFDGVFLLELQGAASPKQHW